MIDDLLSQLQNDLALSDPLLVPLRFGSVQSLKIQLIEAVMHRCPAHFFIAISANDAADPLWMRAWHVAGGRGLTREEASLAAALEAMERAALFRDGRNDSRLDPEVSRQGRSYSTEELTQFSSFQLQQLRAMWKYNTTSSCELSVDNSWINGRDAATGEIVSVPASVVLFPEHADDGPIVASSSGTAIRDTAEGAAEHALFELVERDAVAIWWYNRLVAPRLAPDWSASLLPDPLSRFIAERGRMTWHLVLDTDLPSAVVVAVSARADGSRPAVGAAAKPTLRAAVTAATLEVLQIEISLGQMRAAANVPGVTSPPLLAWSDSANALATPYLLGTDERTPDVVSSSVDTLVEAFTAGAIEVVLVDLTRPEIGLPVVRAVSPQLRDWLPRFGPGRLYDVPVRLGLRTAPTAERELNTSFVL